MATDTGSNYFLINGGETPAPPTTLPPEIAALFGPVTASGYAQPPIDPLSYYNPAPPPVETTPYTGGPTKWYEVYRPTPETPAPTPTPAPVTPDLSSVETFNPLPQEPVTPAEPEPAAPPTAYEQVAAEEPEVSVLPDWIKEYYVKYGTMPIYTPGNRGDSYVREDGAIVTPEGTANILPPGPAPTITLPPESVTATPAPQTQVITQPPVFEERVTVTTPPKAPEFEFQEPAPTRNPIVLPGTSVLSRPVITTPLPDLPVNPVLTRNMETMPGRYFRDINYDPEEILAAAMRSMGGRMARRSILNELS
jgi:hypothetical protein